MRKIDKVDIDKICSEVSFEIGESPATIKKAFEHQFKYIRKHIIKSVPIDIKLDYLGRIKKKNYKRKKK